jgi:hypothetical protein
MEAHSDGRPCWGGLLLQVWLLPAALACSDSEAGVWLSVGRVAAR